MNRLWHIVEIIVAINLVQLGSVAALGETDPLLQKAYGIASSCVRNTVGDSLYDASVELAGGGGTNEFYRADFYFRPSGMDEKFMFSVFVSESGECVTEHPYLKPNQTPLCAQRPEWCEVNVSRAQADSIVTKLGLEPFPNSPYSSDNRRDLSLGVGDNTRRIVWKAVKSWPIGNGAYAARVIELDALRGEVLVDYADTLR